MGEDNSTNRVISAGLGFVPILGSVKCLTESISGRDLITGTHLSSTERSLSAVGAIPAFQGVKYWAKATKYGSRFYKTVDAVDKANGVYSLSKSFN